MAQNERLSPVKHSHIIQGKSGIKWILNLMLQGRRRLLESGTAIGRRRRSPSAEGTSGGRAREGIRLPLVGGGGGLEISPMKFCN